MLYTYSGFPLSTSSETTNASGFGMPAFWSAAVAYVFVADVQIAQRGLGPLLTGSSSVMISRTPGSAMMPLRPFRVELATIASSKRFASRWVDGGVSEGGLRERCGAYLLFLGILDAAVAAEVLYSAHAVRDYRRVDGTQSVRRRLLGRSKLTAQHLGDVQLRVLLLEQLPCADDTGRRVNEGAVHVEQAV